MLPELPTYPLILMPPALEQALAFTLKPRIFAELPPSIEPTELPLLPKLVVNGLKLIGASSAAESVQRNAQREHLEHLEQERLRYERRREVFERDELQRCSEAKIALERKNKARRVLESSVADDGLSGYVRQGVSEMMFARVLIEHFGERIRQRLKFHHPSGAVERPYCPDFVYFDAGTRLRIDIEIDEPYAGISRLAIHEVEFDPKKKDWVSADNARDHFFLERKWLVLRFAEEQVVREPLACCRKLAELIERILPEHSIPIKLQDAKTLEPVPRWTREQGNIWGAQQYRETTYLKLLAPEVREQRVDRAPLILPEPSPHQAAILKAIGSEDRYHLLVTAVAGSGKTTTLIQIVRTAQTQPKHGRLLVAAFSRSIRDELDSRIRRMNAAEVTVKTINGFGRALVAEHLGYAPTKGGSKEELKVNRKKYTHLIYKYKIAQDQVLATLVNSGERAVKHLSIKKLQEHVKSLVKFCRAYGLHPDDDTGYFEVANSEQLRLHPMIGIELKPIVQSILRDGLRSAQQKADIDFDDQCWLPVIWQLQPKTPFAWVLIDEAQDLTRAQLWLLQGAVGHTGRLIFVGDEHQAIMAFRGADSQSIEHIRRRLDIAVREYPLSVCYRCPSSHLEQVKSHVPQIESASGAARGVYGDIGLQEFLTRVAPGDLVLARSNATLEKAALRLWSHGFRLGFKEEANSTQARAKPADQMELDDDDEVISNPLGKLRTRVVTVAKSAIEQSRASGRHVLDVLMTAVAPQKKDDLEFEIQRLLQGLAQEANTPDGFWFEVEQVSKPDLNGVKLFTVHGAKGLEAHRVFILEPSELDQPHSNASEVEQQQLRNLRYVALTRAKSELYRVIKSV